MAKAMKSREAKDGGQVVSGYCAETCCRIAAALARLGNGSEVDIAEALGVSVSTLYTWRDVHPELAASLKSAPSCSDAAVERALLRTALPSYYSTDKIVETREGPVVRNVTVHAPPNVEALEFLLRARLPDVYGRHAKAMRDPLYKATYALKAARAAVPLASSEEPIDETTFRVTCVMARLLASKEEISVALDTSTDQFENLVRRYPELAEALRSGKEHIDTALERALTQRALGYEYREEELFCSREGDIVRTAVLKHLPPDRKAQDLWGWGLEVRSASS